MKNTIFTTGAFLVPMKTVDSFGTEQWTWCVAKFVDDSYKDGEVFNPPETACSVDELVRDEYPHE